MLKGEEPIYFSGTTVPKHEHESRDEEDLGSGHDRDGHGGDVRGGY
jgi:hypothetical protein